MKGYQETVQMVSKVLTILYRKLDKPAGSEIVCPLPWWNEEWPQVIRSRLVQLTDFQKHFQGCGYESIKHDRLVGATEKTSSLVLWRTDNGWQSLNVSRKLRLSSIDSLSVYLQVCGTSYSSFIKSSSPAQLN